MGSSDSPTHGQQEGAVWNGHFGCTCYRPLFRFGFIVTNLTRPARRVAKFYNGRGTAEQHIQKGKNALR